MAAGIEALATGFATAATPMNLAYALAGCLLGTLVGVLPGIGSSATLAILLPFVYDAPVTSSFIMLAGVYYGAQYGGSTTAILLNLPGESSSVVTCLDGHKLAKRGFAGAALATAGVSSFIAGCIGVVLLAAFAAPLSSFAFEFSSTSYVALLLLGLFSVVQLSNTSAFTTVCLVVVGAVLGSVGTNTTTGELRLTFGIPDLVDGISFSVLAMGLFGCGQIINSLTTTDNIGQSPQVTNVWLTRADFRAVLPATLRSSVIGAVLGVLPGGGSTISSFMAYNAEKRISGTPAVGDGSLRGVAAPEAANNASTQTAFIPLLSLGIPETASTAILFSVLISHNIQPGPQLITNHADIFWGVVASMFIGNAMLLVINVPLVRLWVQLLKIPTAVLSIFTICCCIAGAYAVSNNEFNIVLLIMFSVVGWILARAAVDPTPLMLGFVLIPALEENFNRAVLLANGDWGLLLSDRIAMACCAIMGVLLLARIGRRLAFVGSR